MISFETAMSVVWLGVVIVMVVLEVSTTNLVSIWFALGGAVALVASVKGLSLYRQMLLFVAVSAAALALTRPLVRRFLPPEFTRTNADRVLGTVGRVTETVDEDSGAVYVDGKTWSARSASGDTFPQEARVRVERIEGVKLYVTRA